MLKQALYFYFSVPKMFQKNQRPTIILIIKRTNVHRARDCHHLYPNHVPLCPDLKKLIHKTQVWNATSADNSHFHQEHNPIPFELVKFSDLLYPVAQWWC